MALVAGNIRSFGSDLDRVWRAPIGTTLPTTLAAPGAGFTDEGWLNPDGIPFTPSSSIEKFRGHQGGKVVKTVVTESGLTFTYGALETKKETLALQHNITSGSTATGVTTMNISTSQPIKAFAFVLDLFDSENTAIQYRYVIARGEVGERQEFSYARGSLTGFNFQVEVIDSYILITNDPAAVLP